MPDTTKLPLTEAGGMPLAEAANWYANRVIEGMEYPPRPGAVRLKIRDVLQEAYIAGARRKTEQALSEPTDAISIRMAHVAALRAARDVPYLKENYTASSDELDSIADELEAEPIDA